MQTQRIDLGRVVLRGTYVLVALALYSCSTLTASADHSRDTSAYQVNAILGKTVEVLVMMQESVDSDYYDYTEKKEDTEYYDYTKKKEDTEYYDYTKKKEYTDPGYTKTTVSSAADLEQLLEQIKQLQALIMVLLELQRATLEQTTE